MLKLTLCSDIKGKKKRRNETSFNYKLKSVLHVMATAHRYNLPKITLTRLGMWLNGTALV